MEKRAGKPAEASGVGTVWVGGADKLKISSICDLRGTKESPKQKAGPVVQPSGEGWTCKQKIKSENPALRV